MEGTKKYTVPGTINARHMQRINNPPPPRARFSGVRPLLLPRTPVNHAPPQAPEHVGQGMTQALLYMGDTIQDGVTGFFMKPARGAKKHGVSGFIKGVGKGFAGLIAAPVSGDEQIRGDRHERRDGLVRLLFTIARGGA